MKLQHSIALLFALPIWILAHHPDTKAQKISADPQLTLEYLDAMNSGERPEEEWEWISEQLQELFENKVSVNSEEITLLSEYGLITGHQLNKLREYRFMYGALLSLNELACIQGWDDRTRQRVLPFLALETLPGPMEKSARKKHRTRSEWVLSAGRMTQTARAYLPDSSDGNGLAHYAGSPWKLGLRYDLKVGNWLAAGLRAEKDPGEEILPYHTEYGAGLHYPDHLSAYIVLSLKGILKKVCLGDYQVSFGRGLSLSTRRGFSSWKDPLSQATPHMLIRQYTSMAEYGYFRGIALHLSAWNLSFYPFYSNRKRDPSGYHEQEGSSYFTSFTESGYHRTQAEKAKRGLLDETTYGGILSYEYRRFRAGIISYYSRLSLNREPLARSYAKFSFCGRHNWTSGAFVELFLKKSKVFGEVSYSVNQKLALLAGWHAILSPSVRVSLDIRHFPVDFQPGFHSAGAGAYGSTSNETGLLVSIDISLPARWSLAVATDYARIPWFGYGLDFSGHRYALHMRALKSSLQHKVLLGYTYRQADENHSAGFSYFHSIQHFQKHQLDMQLIINDSDNFRHKTRLSAVLLQANNGEISSGTILQQELTCRLDRPGIRFSLGGVLFYTDDYGSRLYTYEASILFSSGSQMYSGRGMRSYALIHFSLGRLLECWLRAGMTIYHDVLSIGSGWDEAEGNIRSDIEAQLRMRL